MHTAPNGKVYVGITGQRPSKRWQRGEGYAGSVFYNAIKKYGWDNISHKIIATGLTRNEAEDMEIGLIASLNSNDRRYGYNIESGGKTSPMSEETKRKISNSHLGEKNPMFGKKMTEEAKAKKSEMMRGTHRSEKTKRKISQKAKGRPIHENTRKAVAESNKRRTGHIMPENTRKALAESNRKRIANGELYKCLEQRWAQQRISVSQYSINGELINTYRSINEAAKSNNLYGSNISKCLRGELKTSGGFVWGYAS